MSDPADVGSPPEADAPVLVRLETDPGWRPSADPTMYLGSMVDAALTDGYTGLRVLTDATDLAAHPDSRAAWARSEHLIDRYSPHHALTIVCGYDLDHLGDGLVAETACVHARTGGTPCSFLLHATDDDGYLGLVGEVDRHSAPALGRAVTTIAAGLPAPLVVDLSELVFIDHTGLAALQRAALDLGTRVRLVGGSPLVAVLVDALDLDRLSVPERS